MNQDEIFAQLLSNVLFWQVMEGLEGAKLQALAVDLAKAWKAGITEIDARSSRNTPEEPGEQK